jgi:Rieske Fe-S protein
MPTNGRQRLDARIDSAAREGLTGTAPGDIYGRLHDPEEVTTAPDGKPMDEQPAWRADFPIDWPQDHYVERRDFMKFIVLTSAAFTVGQFWIGAQNWLRRRRGRPEIVRVAASNEIAEGSTHAFTYPTAQDKCVVVRQPGGALVAYSQECTHLSCAVVPHVEEGVIRCPCHEGYFDLATGRPIAGPPRRPLTRVILEARGDEVFAVGVEERTT